MSSGSICILMDRLASLLTKWTDPETGLISLAALSPECRQYQVLSQGTTSLAALITKATVPMFMYNSHVKIVTLKDHILQNCSLKL